MSGILKVDGEPKDQSGVALGDLKVKKIAGLNVLVDEDGKPVFFAFDNSGNLKVAVTNASITIDPTDINLDFAALETLIGEKQATPTANTILGRIKLITDLIDNNKLKVEWVDNNGTPITPATALKILDKDGTNGLVIDSSGRLTLTAGELHLGEVGGNSIQVSASPTNQANAYHAGDCVGTKLTFTNAMRKSDGTGILQSLVILDTDNVKPEMDLILFNADPSASTFTDHSAPSINTADVSKIIRRVHIYPADYQTVGGIAIADISPGGRMLTGVGTANLYGILVATATPTFTHTTPLTCKLGIMRD